MVIHSRQQGFGIQVADSRTRGYTNGTSQSPAFFVDPEDAAIFMRAKLNGWRKPRP